jgi:chromosome segregation ATPase
MNAVALRRAEEVREVVAAIGDTVQFEPAEGAARDRLAAAERGRLLLQDQLRHARRSLEVERASRAEEVQVLSAELDVLRGQLARADVDIGHLRAQAAAVDPDTEATVRTLRARVAELEAAQHLEAARASEIVAAEIAALRERIETTRRAQLDAEGHVGRLQAETVTLRATIARQSDGARARQEKTRLQDVRRRADEAEERLQCAQKQLDALTEDRGALLRLLRTGPKSIRATVANREAFAESLQPVPRAARLLAAAYESEPEGPGRLAIIRALSALLNA